MTKLEIVNVAIQLANKEIERSTKNQNFLQVIVMKSLIRRLLLILDEV